MGSKETLYVSPVVSQLERYPVFFSLGSRYCRFVFPLPFFSVHVSLFITR